ncbi:MAG TPA: co-chaperone GroES [Chloroflexi bacterium]|nr:co-chaperone GroES [Chloroflexota bacterium]HHW87371.1 co-chaperone GroES [Chloroflexota bacterium]
MSVNGNKPGIEPLGARVLLKPVEQEDRTSSGLYLPETAKEKPQMAVVIAVGDDEDIKLKVDDKVLFAKYSGTEVSYQGQTYLLMDVSDVLARIVS